MIKYFGTNTRNLIKFNKCNEQCDLISSIRDNIDYIWIIDEDGELDGKEVNAGDIVFKLYPVNSFSDCEYIIIKDEQLKNYYNRLLGSIRNENIKEISFSAYDGCERIKEN